jgi:hypothetical protein
MINPTEREINIIRGKLVAGAASRKEIERFLVYVSAIEALVEEASDQDVYGTEGYQHRLGWD